MGCIYLRKNKVNGKCYIGQAKDIKERNRQWNNLNFKYGGCVINNARKKYGTDGFSFEILKECEDKDMNYWEMYYIKEYNCKKPYGYNSTDGGDSSYERSEETKKKISEAKRGKKQSPEHIEKCAAAKRCKKQSIETIAKRAAAMRGRKLSTEHKSKISAAHRGMKQSQETIEKRVAKLRGRKLSEETKAKVADALRGRKRSAEAVAKSAAAHRGKKLSEEHKAKIGVANKNNPKNSKAVQALDKVTGEVVMEFPSTQEAERQFGFDHGAVSKCCLGKLKTYKGLIWRFAS
jgi:group I intron endonuclease